MRSVMSEPRQLPSIIPVFPLTGSVLLPGNWLPLHVFEPRYKNMVEDAMSGDRVIGMIQPMVPRQDNLPPAQGSSEEDVADENISDDAPELYAVGCVGHLEECEPLSGGRLAIALKGLSRFRVRREVDAERGYRRVEADYEEFASDLEEMEAGEPPEQILGALQAFGDKYKFTFDVDRLRDLAPIVLVNGLAMALPFGPAEKQALLEAAASQREEILLTLLKMGVDLEEALDPREPTLH